MNALRWILGLTTAGAVLCVVALVVIGGNFRRSFGASDTNPVVILLPIACAAILFAGLLFPSQRILLHLGAIASASLLALCLFNLSGIGFLGIIYFGLWLLYYWFAAWHASPVSRSP